MITAMCILSFVMLASGLLAVADDSGHGSLSFFCVATAIGCLLAQSVLAVLVLVRGAV